MNSTKPFRWKEFFLHRFQLMRLANVFTAMADVLAGYLIVAGADLRISVLLSLTFSSAAIYAGGCVLNDICDLRIDLVERPERPLPAGKVSIFEALVIVVVLFVSALIMAGIAGLAALLTAVILIVLVLSYDLVTKDMVFFGSLNMGGCRALNLLFGMSPLLIWDWFLIFPLISLVYIFLLTSLSNFETGGYLGEIKWPLAGGFIILFTCLVGVAVKSSVVFTGLLLIVVMMVYVLPSLCRALINSEPALVGAAVKRLLLAIPLLDAFYVGTTRGLLYSIPVLLCLLPARWLAKKLSMT